MFISSQVMTGVDKKMLADFFSHFGAFPQVLQIPEFPLKLFPTVKSIFELAKRKSNRSLERETVNQEGERGISNNYYIF